MRFQSTVAMPMTQKCRNVINFFADACFSVMLLLLFRRASVCLQFPGLQQSILSEWTVENASSSSHWRETICVLRSKYVHSLACCTCCPWLLAVFVIGVLMLTILHHFCLSKAICQGVILVVWAFWDLPQLSKAKYLLVDHAASPVSRWSFQLPRQIPINSSSNKLCRNVDCMGSYN